MILSDTAILAARQIGDIVIEPFNLPSLGGNSYDVHLARTLVVYKLRDAQGYYVPLDCAQPAITEEIKIPEKGYLLQPGTLYLASTVEYTETHKHVPYLDGKSSVGRLGIAIHATAGRGDVGFCNHWTLEISVIHPVRVYAGQPIGQLTYHTVDGEVERVYSRKAGGTYGHLPPDPKPQPSLLYTKLRG